MKNLIIFQKNKKICKKNVVQQMNFSFKMDCQEMTFPSLPQKFAEITYMVF